MQGMKERTWIDSRLAQPLHQVITNPLIDGAHQQNRKIPIAVEGALARRRQFDQWLQAGQAYSIARGKPELCGEQRVDMLQLCETDCGLQVGHSVVIPDFDVPITALRVHTVVAQHARARCNGRIAEQQHPAFTGGDQFIAEERECAGIPESTGVTTAFPRTKRLSRILDHQEAVALGEVAQRIHMAHLSIEVNRHDRLGAGADG